MKKSIILSLILLSCRVEATESTMQLRHREAGGIGYSTGYTSLDYFLTAGWDSVEFLVNLRGHLMNDMRAAGNAGFGFRCPVKDEKYLLGANVFYDFRETSHLFAHQVGAGLEALSENVDLRLNGYLPFGTKKHFDHRTFEAFSGNSVLVRRKLKATLPVIEGEIGTPLPKPFYFAAGSYYLFQQESRGLKVGNATGVKARAEVDLGRYFKLGFSISYDRIFHTRAQGILSFNIPLGGKWKSQETCPRNLRAVPIMRNEIIPIQDKRKTSSTLTITAGDDDADPSPIDFVFVDNTASEPGDGSFEKPFATLKEAEVNSEPGDVIYVFPGDGTPQGMDEGIILKEDQIIASSGAPLEIEEVIIPIQTPGESPMITNINEDQPIVANPGHSRLDDFIFIPPWEYIFGNWFPYFSSSDTSAPDFAAPRIEATPIAASEPEAEAPEQPVAEPNLEQQIQPIESDSSSDSFSSSGSFVIVEDDPAEGFERISRNGSPRSSAVVESSAPAPSSAQPLEQSREQPSEQPAGFLGSLFNWRANTPSQPAVASEQSAAPQQAAPAPVISSPPAAASLDQSVLLGNAIQENYNPPVTAREKKPVDTSEDNDFETIEDTSKSPPTSTPSTSIWGWLGYGNNQ